MGVRRRVAGALVSRTWNESTLSLLGNRHVSSTAARVMQQLGPVVLDLAARRRGVVFPEHAAITEELTIPNSIAPAPVVVYRPADVDPHRPVHVNFHGGGYVTRGIRFDDPLCRYLAAEAGVVVVNVDYVVAPQFRFPAPPVQAFEVVRWIAEHGTLHGWCGDRLTVGGQSAGGGLAAAVARQALERRAPAIALQVLHYPPLDLMTPAGEKRSRIAKPLIRPWMGEVFDNAYVPDVAQRANPLVSPANPVDTADLTGIAPALVISAEFDVLRDEAARYAERLRAVGALVEHYDVPGADHAYDMDGGEQARRTYALIARSIRQATA